MATVSLTISDALDAKISAADGPWGSTANWKAWVKAETKREILNHRLRKVDADAAAVAEAARKQILAEPDLS